MSRTIARHAIERTLRQYLDLLEPITPPPHPELWVTANQTTYVMSPLNPSEELARVELDPYAKKATVLINAYNLYEFIPEADDHITERIPQLPYDPTEPAYVLTTDLSDLDWDTVRLDDDTPTRKLPRTPPHTPTTAHYQKVKRG